MPNGSITYGTGTTTTVWAPNGTIVQQAPSTPLEPAFQSLAETFTGWNVLASNGTITDSNPWWTTLRFEGADAGVNVFDIDTTVLQQARAIEIRVPDGATALIRVAGDNYTTANLSSIRLWDGTQYRQFNDNDPAARDKRSRLLWAFTDAKSITIGPSLSWEGTVLAGDAAITINGSVPIHGTVIARTITGSATGYNDLPADDIQLP